MIVLELPEWIEIQRKLIRSPDEIKFRVEMFEKRMMEYTIHEYITTMACVIFDTPDDEVLFRIKWL